MLNIEYSNVATEQLNEIYENDNIYIGTSFTQQFINWNHEFYRYVNENAISKHKLYSQGIYTIGKIGKLEYKYFTLKDADVFEIIEFRFSKLPYKKQNSNLKIVGNGGYGYKIAQSLFNNKYAIFTPQNKRLCRFVFDYIIGFYHHFGFDKLPTAIGFMGNRIYEIDMEGNIWLVRNMSKSDFLNKEQPLDEVNKRFKFLINECTISVIKELYYILERRKRVIRNEYHSNLY